MKHLLLVVAALGLLPAVAGAAAEEYELDPNHTYPHFALNHLGFSTTRGRFNETSGTVVVDREGSGSSVKVKVKTASIDTGHKKRDDHLRNADFFDVERYPEMTFESTRVKFTGKDGATVEGNLTLHGVTKPLTLEVTRLACGPHPMRKTPVCGFDAKGKLKRSEFGMGYGLPAIGDEVELLIQAEGQRQDAGAPPKKGEAPKQ